MIPQFKKFVLDNVYILAHNAHKENLLNAQIVMQDIIWMVIAVLHKLNALI